MRLQINQMTTVKCLCFQLSFDKKSNIMRKVQQPNYSHNIKPEGSI